MANKVILTGNVGKDPEIRSFQNGDKLASFSLATTESWKDKSTGERKTATEWHNIQVFGGIVNVVESYVSKGSKLYIEGKLKTRSYESNGEKKYVTEVVLQGFGGVLEMLDSRSSEPKASAPVEGDEFTEDSIPF